MQSWLRRCWPGLWLAFGVLVITLEAPAQMLDLNGNGVSDVWEAVFNAVGLDPNADTDGDGASNKKEAMAGTDPFDPASFPRMLTPGRSGTNITLSFPAALGKQYQLFSLPTGNGGLGPATTNWTLETTVVARTGSVLSFSVSAGGVARFFRVAISDLDSDGDGLNDWEEYQLGLDPLNAYSNGQLDASGRPMNDYAYVLSRFANAVSIRAVLPAAVTQPAPGSTAVPIAAFVLERSGVPLNSLVVNLSPSDAGAVTAVEGVDYASLSRSLTLPSGVRAQPLMLVPLANTNRLSPAVVSISLLPGAGYTLGAATNAAVAVYPSPLAQGNGLTGEYFSNSSPSYSASANFNPTNLVFTRLDSTVDFSWGTNSPVASATNFTVRWTGQVMPQYSEPYTFVLNTAAGAQLWVNGQRVINDWVLQNATESFGTINLLAGVRYDLRVEYFNFGGSAAAHLFWSSPSQPRQVVPSSRLYSATNAPGPVALTSPLTALAFLGQPFTYTVTAVNSPLAYGAAPLPAGLTFNSTNGLLSGIPTLAGLYQITLTATNSLSAAAAMLALQVVDTNALGNGVTREVWSSVVGTNVSDIPVNTAATLITALPALEGPTNFGDNYGERLTGYLTPAVSGNYYFWIAASDSAELWISSSSEPASKVRRAFVLPSPNPSPPHLNGTGIHEWNLQPNQKSPWLALAAGQRYYVEILHKAGVGTNDTVAVGWLLDPRGTGTFPSGVVPNAVLSPYFAPPTALIPGTLYAANLDAQGTAASPAYGSAALRLSPDGSQAVLSLSYTGLTSTVTGRHIHSDPYLGNSSQILFDIDAATPQPDGTYRWNIGPVGTLVAADVVEIIREGKAFLNVHTVNFPAGEISGHFTLAAGAASFSPPSAPPSWMDDHTDANAADRFLIQATFGPTAGDIAAVQTLGYEAWLNQQFSLPVSHHLPYVLTNVTGDPRVASPQPTLSRYAWWQQSVTAPDQLRQRVAFALSEIFVVSSRQMNENGCDLSAFYDTLLDNAFGNYRTLLKAVTLTPAMGFYLGMLGNTKGDPVSGTHPNENYARECLQLFSIGLNRLWPDGSLVTDSTGNLVPTYSQEVVMSFANVFTGWNFAQSNQSNGLLPVEWYPPADYLDPMVLVPTHHELSAKRLLDNVVLPAATDLQTVYGTTNCDAYCSQDLETALDTIFRHPNVGPFICRQLIQRLVTSNPSPGYVYRVVQKFNDNGCGVRGDLQAVVTAILLDYEARSSALAAQSTYGKLREPLLRVTAMARAFPCTNALSTWQMPDTSDSLFEEPLGSPTVFNFFRPDYKFPGALAAAGLTTPEFQVEADMMIVQQLNALAGGFYANSSPVVGLTSFFNGDGSLMLDFRPWMTADYTASAAGVASLVDSLNRLLLAGQLSPGAKDIIVNFVSDPASFPISTSPTPSEMRDRVEAVVHLLVISPDFTLQK